MLPCCQRLRESVSRDTYMKRIKQRRIILSVLSVLLFLFGWWLITDGLNIYAPTTLPSPWKVLNTLIDKITNPNPDGATLIQHIFVSFKTMMIAWILGAVIGIPTGMMMSWFKPVDLFVRPLFDLIRPVPGLAWIPVFITLLGIGESSRIAVLFIASLIGNILNSYSGIRQTKDVHFWVGQTFGATDAQLFFTVALPSSLPMVMTGLRLTMGSCWMCIVAAEMLAANRGLGYMIQQARGTFRPDIVIAGMIVIGMIGTLLNLLLNKLESVVIRGRRL